MIELNPQVVPSPEDAPTWYREVESLRRRLSVLLGGEVRLHVVAQGMSDGLLGIRAAELGRSVSDARLLGYPYQHVQVDYPGISLLMLGSPYRSAYMPLADAPLAGRPIEYP